MAAPTTWQVDWKDQRPDRLRRVEDVDALLDILQARGEPLLAAITGLPSDGTLLLGFAGALGVLSHTPASGDPPYRTSVGDAAAEGIETLFRKGHPSEIPRRHLIPLPLAREAVRRFCAEGILSEAVVWEEL